MRKVEKELRKKLRTALAGFGCRSSAFSLGLIADLLGRPPTSEQIKQSFHYFRHYTGGFPYTYDEAVQETLKILTSPLDISSS